MRDVGEGSFICAFTFLTNESLNQVVRVASWSYG